jgi:diaminopimelate epimerase
MRVPFVKYQGTGNDFILIDQRQQNYISHAYYSIIAKWCDRRFGIGADGLILLENSDISDFRMVYFNADGRQSSMCGNGGRCIVQFASLLGLFETETVFEAVDGLHEGRLLSDGLVSLKMCDVNQITELADTGYELNTGSPHYVQFRKTLPDDIKNYGSAIRFSKEYKEEGINVNFVCESNGDLVVATYERGVEDETLSCGTGVTAAALANSVHTQKFGPIETTVLTKGGHLKVSFNRDQTSFNDIWLTGPAVAVFTGEIEK